MVGLVKADHIGEFSVLAASTALSALAYFSLRINSLRVPQQSFDDTAKPRLKSS